MACAMISVILRCLQISCFPFLLVSLFAVYLVSATACTDPLVLHSITASTPVVALRPQIPLSLSTSFVSAFPLAESAMKLISFANATRAAVWLQSALSCLAIAAPSTLLSQRQSSIALPAGLDLLSVTVVELGAYLSNGSLTSSQLVQAYLERIDLNNHQGLNLRAILEVAPKETVLKIAESLDAERASGRVRGPMHGIPILIKDNVATAVELGMNTTAGSFALLGPQVPRDAGIVAKLRKAGAIIIGKSNLSEFANFKGNITNGWSARGGQTQSAYVAGGFPSGGDPCGSSAGSGVGVSAGFAPIAIGTETDGSIICPSNRAALYGIKPTVGLASRAGIVPISSVQDSPGPMARSAADAALLLTIIAGYDELDHATLRSKGNTHDYSKAIIPHGFKGLNIGVPRQYFYNSTRTGLESEVYETTETVLRKIASLGSFIQDPANLPSTEELFAESNNNETIGLEFDFKQDLATYLKGLVNSTVLTLADVINYNDKNAVIEMPVGECCQETLIEAVQTTNREDPVYIAAHKANIDLGGTRGLQAVFDEFGLNALAIPAEVATTPAALVGWPIATVPIGYYGEGSGKVGQPYGLAFIARPFHERTLVRIMAAFEENFPKRKTPGELSK